MTEFHARLRTLRLAAGLTVAVAARNARVSVTTWNKWERGQATPKLSRGHDIASALAVPVIALFTDQVAIADVVLMPETVARIRKEGRSAAAETAQRLAQQLEPAIYDAATRKPVDTRAGARAKPRKTRAERLAELNARPKRQAPKSIE